MPEKDAGRLAVLKKAEDYERLGLFDKDLEDDPPTVPLEAGKVDYTGKKLSTRIMSEIANRMAKRHFDGCIKKGELVIKEVHGMENYRAVSHRGVIITANHFNPFDNYAVFKAIERPLGKRRLYKIIREGNYTSFGGLYGFFFRHCNTLPLGSDRKVLKELTDAVSVLLERKEKILIYPEQGMWWNYRKPRPLKEGAFRFAVKNGAPVLPFFITMEETDRIGADGFPILAYTVNILPPIYPKEGANLREDTKRMCEENFELWKECYENFYGIPLKYGNEE
ncbi:MAG: 1-acyl-sn-glycerol-3-phosphate acyltransferase [Ruminococcaceae bacterium]|nr:1-acyl-sn-glycerol-3-phosphate acyltransferase [Oscillospiraceae bacterium]